WSALQRIGLDKDTPLWYYILLEAQLEPGTPRKVGAGARKIGGIGATLGRVGSRIVAEVVEGSLQCDPTSFVRRKDPGWKPEAWTTVDGKQITVESLADVARVAAV